MSLASQAVYTVHEVLTRGRIQVTDLLQLRLYAAVARVSFADIRRALKNGQERLASGVSYDEVYRSVLAVMGRS